MRLSNGKMMSIETWHLRNPQVELVLGSQGPLSTLPLCPFSAPKAGRAAVRFACSAHSSQAPLKLQGGRKPAWCALPIQHSPAGALLCCGPPCWHPAPREARLKSSRSGVTSPGGCGHSRKWGSELGHLRGQLDICLGLNLLLFPDGGWRQWRSDAQNDWIHPPFHKCLHQA